jgi:hypothetical protein
MREVLRGLRRFCIVTLGDGIRALFSFGTGWVYPRAGKGIEAFALSWGEAVEQGMTTETFQAKVREPVL